MASLSNSDEPLESIFERSELPRFDLPAALVQRYGGPLGFSRPRLFANFVSSLDGVVALQAEGDSGPIISQHSQTDRFVMGLLRACADAVIVGAGTFRKASGHVWSASAIYPPAAELYAEARARLGLRPQPQLVLISRSGELDVSQPALRDAWVVTARSGTSRLCDTLPAGAELISFDSDGVKLPELIERLHARGLSLLLTEGGPSLFAELVAARLIDELFLTSSPTLFGRQPGDSRKSLAAGADLNGAPFELLSARRHGSHLFLRYALQRS
jgi:riboflavin biosynthesis pyrimidine reductase